MTSSAGNSTPPAHELTQWIRRVLTRGPIITDALRAFMQTTFGSCDPAQILNSADPCERDTLLELLFFPDATQRIDYESRWGDHLFTASDQAAIVAELTTAPVSTRFDPESGAPPFVYELPSFVVVTFIERLNLGWRAPEPIRAAVENLTDRGWADTIMAALRHAGLAWHAGQITVLMRWLETAHTQTVIGNDVLAWLPALLAELEPDQSPWEFFIGKKAFYFQSLCQAEAFEHRRRNEPMELLILQGCRAACGSIDQWRRNMARIDQICELLFGRTRFFQRPADQVMSIAKSRDQLE